MARMLRQLVLRLYALAKRRRKSALACVALLLIAWDQKRRSKLAALRFASLYRGWSESAAAKQSLQRWHGLLVAELRKHDPAQLRAKFGVDRADIAIAGGGFKSIYGFGAYFALRYAGVKVERASGASSGSYLAAVMLGREYKLDDLLHENLLGWCDCVVRAITECKTIFLGPIWDFMSAELTKRLDGWLPAADTLFVSVTTLTARGLRGGTISTFSSPEDLEQTISASMAIPFILCNGPFRSWRGQFALDGGFMNNCPVHIFHAAETPASTSASISPKRADRIVVKCDGNRIATMAVWQKFLYVVYAPLETCGGLVLEGMQDMLKILSSQDAVLPSGGPITVNDAVLPSGGPITVNGITVIPPGEPIRKREYSYQLLPGKEHLRRLSQGKHIIGE